MDLIIYSFNFCFFGLLLFFFVKNLLNIFGIFFGGIFFLLLEILIIVNLFFLFIDKIIFLLNGVKVKVL